MKKLKLAILGNGFLADIIVEVACRGLLDEYELTGILGRTKEKTEKLAQKGHCQACETIEELLGSHPDYVAEAASVQSVRDYGEQILSAGASLIVLSIWRFCGHAGFYGEMQGNSKRAWYKDLYWPPGQWGIRCAAHSISYGTGKGRHMYPQRAGFPQTYASV